MPENKQPDSTANMTCGNPCYMPNPGLGLAEILITGGLVAVGALGVIMGLRTVKTSPQMPSQI